MRKILVTLLACIMSVAFSLGIGVMASAESTTEGTPFSTVTNNPNSLGSATVTGGQTGPWDVNLNSSYGEADSRLYYGEDNAPYIMDLRTFSMKFVIDELATNATMKISFLEDQNQFPMDGYGTGFSLMLTDDANKGLIVKGISHPTNANFQAWYLVYDNSNPRVEDYRDREILLEMYPEAGKFLHIHMNFTSTRDTTVDFHAQYPLTEDFDYTRSILFFNLQDNKGSDANIDINEIKGIRASDATEPTYPVPDVVWELDKKAPFTTYGDFVGNVAVHKNEETGYSDIVAKSNAATMTRAWYGETNNIYSVDLTDFTMKLHVDQFGADNKLILGFMSNYNDYPLDTYGTGYSLEIRDSGDSAFVHEANCGYYVNAYKFASGQTCVKENGYLIYNNQTVRPSSLGKEIVIKTTYANDQLTIAWNFTREEGTEPYGESIVIAKADLPAGFDVTNCVLLLSASGTENIKYSVRSIEENITKAYLESEARANALQAIEDKVAELSALNSIAELLVADTSVDLSALRMVDKLSVEGWEEKAFNGLLDKLVAGNQTAYEATSNYTGDTRNNNEGAYAEYDATTGLEYLVLLNKFDQSNGGSSLLMQKTVDITNFEMSFRHVFIAQDTRVSFQFANDLEAYNYQQLTFPGLCVLTMFRDGQVYLMITNTNGAKNIEGVSLDQYHVLLNDEGSWMGMPVNVGDLLTLSLKADAEGNIVVALKNGENSIGTSIPKAMFESEQLDVNNMYFKMYSGDQGFASGDNKYTVMFVESISDPSNQVALENAQQFIEAVAGVQDVEEAVALLEMDVSKNMVYIQSGNVFEEVREAIVTLKQFVRTSLTTLATDYATKANALEDVTAENLTQAKIDAADAASLAYYEKIDYLVYLTDGEITELGNLVLAADEMLGRAKVYFAVNNYVAAVTAITNRAELAAAKALRDEINTADMVYLSAEERAVINKLISDNDKVVSEKDATLPEDAPVQNEEESKSGCFASVTGSALLVMLALGAVAVIRRKED